MAPRLAAPGIAVALAAASVARAEEPGELFLASIPVESAPGLDPAAPLRATLALNPAGAAKVASLREWFPRARAEGGEVAVVLDGRAPAGRAPPRPAHRRASFLLDYEEPALAPVSATLTGERGAPASDGDLARAVDRWIERKTLGSLLDVASTVAARRAGDCTEHAVLLAALARRHGRAARVVFGIALVPFEGRLRAFGHAWAEIHDGRAWRTLDASPQLPGVRYLPMGAIADEGPGFAVGAWGLLSPLDVRKVSLAPAAGR